MGYALEGPYRTLGAEGEASRDDVVGSIEI